MLLRRSLLLPIVFVVVACQNNTVPPPAKKRAEPPPAPVARVAAPPAPLDPVRVETQTANRRALELMSRAIGCPQKLPSEYVKYCDLAATFNQGTAGEIPEGKTLLLPGLVAILEPGPPSICSLGLPMPVVLALRNRGGRISARQVVLLDTQNQDESAIALARVANTIDGKWDHVDVPAGFAGKVADVQAGELDPLEASGGSYWPVELDGMELRRVGNHWMVVASPNGLAGRHIVGIFVDEMKLLAANEKSPQTIKVLRMK